MPYRRLPNTDKARLRALAKSLRKFEIEGGTTLPYSENTLQTIRTLYPTFKNSILNLEAARKNQADKNKIYLEIYKKARMYVSHYLQVMNFAISRGELKPNIRAYYTTDRFDSHMPPLQTENDLFTWGKKVIDGDQQRIMKGGSPFYNPSIALVRINYEKFCESYRFQQNLIATTERSSKLVSGLRKEVDALIVQLWNEIEAHFADLPDQERREKSEEYGLVYILRRKEKKRLLEEAKQAEIQKQLNEQRPAIVELKEKFETKLIKEIPVEKEKPKIKVFQSQLNF